MEKSSNIQDSMEEALVDLDPQNDSSDEPSSFDIMQAVVIALAIIMIFYTGARVGTLTNYETATEQETTVYEQTTVVQTTQTAQTTQAAVVEQTTQVVVTEEIVTQDFSDYEQSETTTQVQEQQDEVVVESETVMPSSTQEILDLFNTSANNVKVSASEVIRNYELVSHDESKLKLSSALQSLGSSLISQFVVDDMTSISYTQEQDFIDHFPISGGYGNVNVTTADISNATITDNGDTYTIILSFNECYDPVDTGVGSAFSLVSKEFVMSITSIIKDCAFYYYDCEITATIDKQTGNLIEANYYMPVAYSITASLGLTLEATVATIVETNYTVNY